jgi:hypothetical protein
MTRLLIFPEIEGRCLRSVHRLNQLEDLRLLDRQAFLDECLQEISGSRKL